MDKGAELSKGSAPSRIREGDSMGKKLFNAFVVGVVVGLTGHFLMILSAMIVPSDFVTPVAMILFGLISSIIIANGAYMKIAAFGGEGAAIPLCGLMFGAAAARAEAQAKGASAGKAIVKGFTSIIIVVGIGFIISFVLGLITKNPGVSTAKELSLPLQFLCAAAFGGIICAITQILACLKIPFPVIAIIMMAVFGGVFTWIGFIPTLNQWGAGGICATAVGCGNGAYMGGALLALAGVPVPLIIAILLNVILVFMGALAGGAMMKKMPSAPTQEQ